MENKLTIGMIFWNHTSHLLSRMRLVWYCGIWLVCQTLRYMKCYESDLKCTSSISAGFRTATEFLCAAQGQVKKTPIGSYSNIKWFEKEQSWVAQVTARMFKNSLLCIKRNRQAVMLCPFSCSSLAFCVVIRLVPESALEPFSDIWRRTRPGSCRECLTAVLLWRSLGKGDVCDSALSHGALIFPFANRACSMRTPIGTL